MLTLKEDYYKPIEENIENYLYFTFFAPIVSIYSDIFNVEIKLNSLDQLATAIKEGKIIYLDGRFKGQFNIALSKEISKFADFDGRSNSWRVKPGTEIPSKIRASIIEYSSTKRRVIEDMELFFGKVEKIDSTLRIGSPIEETLEKMKHQLSKDYEPIGIKINLSDSQRKKLIQDYNKNQTLNIKGWESEQVERLRNMVFRLNEKGFSKENLKDFIQREWEVTSNKASFLARQETSLFGASGGW